MGWSQTNAHLCPKSTHPKWPLNRLELTVTLERHFWHEQGAVCHTYYARFRLESNSLFVHFFCLRRSCSQIFPSSLISPFMLALALEIVHSLLCIFISSASLASASPSLRHLSLIEMDERGYHGVWVESSADRLNQGRSFTHRKLIHPGTHTYPLSLTHTHTYTSLTKHTLLHKHTAPKWLSSLWVHYFTPGKSGLSFSIQHDRSTGIFSIRRLFGRTSEHTRSPKQTHTRMHTHPKTKKYHMYSDTHPVPKALDTSLLAWRAFTAGVLWINVSPLKFLLFAAMLPVGWLLMTSRHSASVLGELLVSFSR